MEGSAASSEGNKGTARFATRGLPARIDNPGSDSGLQESGYTLSWSTQIVQIGGIHLRISRYFINFIAYASVIKRSKKYTILNVVDSIVLVPVTTF